MGVGDASGLTVWSRWQRQFEKVSTARKKLFRVELQSEAMMVEGERTDVHLDGSCEGSERSFLGTRRRVWLRKLQQSSLIFPSHKSDESEARVHLNLLSLETKRVTMTSRRVRELHGWIFLKCHWGFPADFVYMNRNDFWSLETWVDVESKQFERNHMCFFISTLKMECKM